MQKDLKKQRLIIGISGATGIQYGIRLLELLREHFIETHLIVTKYAHQVRQFETNLTKLDLDSLADAVYHPDDMACKVASGSYKTLGMIILPCSMKTLGEIASGVTTSSLSRAADVVLKERRKLVIAPRETPLHRIHLENMLKICNMGGIIAPPMPAFYNQPKSIDDLLDHTVGRILDLFDIEVGVVKRWQGKREHMNCS